MHVNIGDKEHVSICKKGEEELATWISSGRKEGRTTSLDCNISTLARSV